MANKALLWGARGMGKSSLVKAVHALVSQDFGNLKLVELQREDISSLSGLLGILRASSCKFILFCDDLSFSYDDHHYKSLKAVLDGGVEGSPSNVVFYATSNRRHLMPRDMIENERSTAISPSEAADEKISLSDRFGLWLGFHPCTQAEYLEMVASYCAHGELAVARRDLTDRAIEWQQTRGREIRPRCLAVFRSFGRQEAIGRGGVTAQAGRLSPADIRHFRGHERQKLDVCFERQASHEGNGVTAVVNIKYGLRDVCRRKPAARPKETWQSFPVPALPMSICPQANRKPFHPAKSSWSIR